jgi:hypothetical protein
MEKGDKSAPYLHSFFLRSLLVTLNMISGGETMET